MNRSIEKIPRLVHYCWFGKREKPKLVKRCIESWRRNLTGYTIIEWNESNFDINCNSYVMEAYKAQKYAFVSDYARVFTLYNYGGIYLDTDVEVLKPLDNFLTHDSFWGFEEKNYIATSTIGAEKGNMLIKEFLDYYNGKSFLTESGSFNELTNVAVVSDIINSKGIELNGEKQEVSGLVTIYPRTYFSPYDYINCRSFITENSYTIHYFYKSWLPISVRTKSYIKKMLAKTIGGQSIERLRNILK